MSLIARLLFIFLWFRYCSSLDCDDSGHTNVECSYTIPSYDLFYYVPNIGTSVNLHITLKGAGGGTDNDNSCAPGSGAKIIVLLEGASPGEQLQITVGEQGWTDDGAIAIGGGGAAVGNHLGSQ